MRGKILIFILTVCTLASVSLYGQVTQNDTVAEDLNYDGIDVSGHQKMIDWATTARDKKIQFVYIKATEGATHTSRHYRRNLDNARKHGVKVGSYHFMRTTSRIRDQFENFTRSVKKNEQDLIPLLDVETMRGWTAEQLRDSVKLFADLIEEYYGCRPLIYTSSSFFNKHLSPMFADYPLFIARYAKSEPRLVNGAKWILWQFSDCGRVKGIDANVDMSRFNKNCSLNDILLRPMKGGVPPPRKKVTETVEVPPPPAKEQVEQPVVPPKKLSKKEKKALEEQRKQQEEIDKRAREAAKKREKEEAKRQAELKKQQEKEAKEAAKREEELRKQQEKEAKEAAKRQEELLKQQQEAQKKLQREKKEQEEKARKDSLEQARKREKDARVSNAFKNASKNRNKSSADNDDALYPTRRRK